MGHVKTCQGLPGGDVSLDEWIVRRMEAKASGRAPLTGGQGAIGKFS